MASSYVVPSPSELERRTTVNLYKETISNITSTDFPGNYPGEDNSWDLEAFRRQFRTVLHHVSPSNLSLSLIGVDASFANAIRRILLAEIPTLAVEDVFISNNTSVIQDEVLAHRLGLIPFRGGREGLLNFMKWYRKPTDDAKTSFSGCFDTNTVQLDLRVQCVNRPASEIRRGETDPTKLYSHAHVYAKDIVFVPTGRQVEYFSGKDAIAPVHPDILIAKMRPGQVIDLTMHMHKGVGADHAKFSPVATAFYRLLPTITITKPILGADAEKFAACFSPGVISLEPVTKREAAKGGDFAGAAGQLKAVVRDPMRDSVSRECLRHAEFDGKVKLGRKMDHFIFSVESTGQWDSVDLFLEAIKHLRVKCQRLEKQLVSILL